MSKPEVYKWLTNEDTLKTHSRTILVAYSLGNSKIIRPDCLGLQGQKQINFKLFNIVTFTEFDNKALMYFAGIYDVSKKRKRIVLRDSVWKIVALLNSLFIIVLDHLGIAKF